MTEQSLQQFTEKLRKTPSAKRRKTLLSKIEAQEFDATLKEKLKRVFAAVFYLDPDSSTRDVRVEKWKDDFLTGSEFYTLSNRVSGLDMEDSLTYSIDPEFPKESYFIFEHIIAEQARIEPLTIAQMEQVVKIINQK